MNRRYQRLSLSRVSPLDIETLKKLVDGYNEDTGQHTEEDEEVENPILLILEDVKKKQEATEIQLEANNIIVYMLMGLQSSKEDHKQEQFVLDGQEKRNKLTQQILLKAAKVNKIEEKQKNMNTCCEKYLKFEKIKPNQIKNKL